MHKPTALLAILLCTGCSAPILRPAISGLVVDVATNKPLPHATIYSYDGTRELAQTDADGRFMIPPLRDTRILFPGDEKGILAPNSDKFCIKKTGFQNDTIFIFEQVLKNNSDTILLDKLTLYPISKQH